MKMDLKNFRTVLTIRRTCTKHHAKLHPFCQKLIGDEKIKYRAFLHISEFIEDTERKMDQMIDADKLHYPYTQMTSNGAFFSGL